MSSQAGVIIVMSREERLTGGINQTALLSLHNLSGAVRPRPNTFTRLNNNQREWGQPDSQHPCNKVAIFY